MTFSHSAEYQNVAKDKYEKQKRRTRAKSDEGRSEKLCDSDPFGDCEGAGNQRKAENGF